MISVEPITIPEGYKQTEVGVIPEGWLVKTFKEICTVNQGLQIAIDRRKKFPTSQSRVYITIQYINSSNEPEYIDDYSSSVCCDPDDVLMTRTGNTGIVVTGVTGVFHNNFFKIDFDRNNINSKYFVYYLRSHDCQKTILDKAGISTIPDLNHGDFYSILMPIPAIKEQTAIANALSDVDNLIASLETLIAKKSAIKTAAMQQLLTGKKRLPAFVKESEKQGAKQSSELDNTSETAQAAQTKQASTLNSDLYKESGEGLDLKSNQHSEVSNANNKQTAPRPGYKQTELGEIPEDWEVKPLGELLSFKNGLNKAKEYFGYGLPIVNYMDVYSNPGIASANIKGMVDVTKEEVAAYSVKKGDVFFTRTSETVNEIGLSTVLLDDIDSGVFSGFVLRGREKSDQLNLMFKKYCFSSYYIRKQIGSTSSYTTRALTNGSLLSNVELIFPSCKKEQAAIANFLSDMDTELDALQQRLSKTQKIKQGMMQELLTGNTRLV